MVAAKPKSADALVDISVVSSWVEKLGTLDLTKLIAEQKTTLVTELTKLRAPVSKDQVGEVIDAMRGCRAAETIRIDLKYLDVLGRELI